MPARSRRAASRRRSPRRGGAVADGKAKARRRPPRRDGGRRPRRPAARPAQEEEALGPAALGGRRRRAVEVEGATLGEAKWAAVKALERDFPGLTPEDVEFEVLDEGRGRRAARAWSATVDVEAWEERARRAARRAGRAGPGAGRARRAGARARGQRRREETRRRDPRDRERRGPGNPDRPARHDDRRAPAPGIAGRVSAARATASASSSTPRGTASGARRRFSRRRTAPSPDALAFGRPVELEPMSAHERKVVHKYLTDRTDIQTHSEGDEPERRLVVTPRRGRARALHVKRVARAGGAVRGSTPRPLEAAPGARSPRAGPDDGGAIRSTATSPTRSRRCRPAARRAPIADIGVGRRLSRACARGRAPDARVDLVESPRESRGDRAARRRPRAARTPCVPRVPRSGRRARAARPTTS